MPKRDYYDVLGVSKSASEDEIKSAYRKLMKKYHPDMNKDKSEEEKDDTKSKLVEVQEAYQVLSDKSKRATYDKYGHAGVGASSGGGAGRSPFGEIDFSDLGDLFGFGGRRGGMGSVLDDLFGMGGVGRAAPKRGGDIEITVPLDFLEAVKGTSKDATYEYMDICPECKGTGADKDYPPVDCDECGGTGQVNAFFEDAGRRIVFPQECEKCGGKGHIIEHACKKCKGSTRIKKRRTMSLNVPPGVEDGSHTMFRGKGHAGMEGGPYGDLVIYINVRPHPDFKRDRYNIRSIVPISYTDAVLGASIDVDTVDGTVSYQIPPGTQTDTEFTIAGKGIEMPISKQTKNETAVRGDHIFTVKIDVPKNLTREQTTALEECRKTLEEDDNNHYDKRKSFFDKLKKD